MKILFIISTLRTGQGGHFHSLNHISREVAKAHEVKIITLGPNTSKIIESNPFFYKSCYFNGRNFFSVRRRLKKVLQSYKPEVLHAFDIPSYIALKFLISPSHHAWVLNRCGGPNPPYFPKVENLINFSKENHEWFARRSQFHTSNLYLIPNRVKAIQTHPIDRMPKDPNYFNFIRIARIGRKYKKSIVDSILMVKELSQKVPNIRLYIIGAIENEGIFAELQEYREIANVIFLTDDLYTVEASRMLYLADAVVGTGRGAMEATSLGLPVLAPASNSNYPIVITEENFSSFFTTNFSERSVASSEDLENNMGLILAMIQDKEIRKTLGASSQNFFHENFDISMVGQKYNEVYKHALENKKNIPLWNDPLIKLKTLRKFFIYK